MNIYVPIIKKRIRTSLFYVFCIGVLSFCHSSSLSDYKGTPYADIIYHEGPQTIPGKLQCEYYDFGGEGVAFHDTEPGEWTKYKVIVKKAGTYQLGIMYTSNQNGKISISVNDKDVTGLISIPSTFVETDSVAWRQRHHWN